MYSTFVERMLRKYYIPISTYVTMITPLHYAEVILPVSFSQSFRGSQGFKILLNPLRSTQLAIINRECPLAGYAAK